jgi:hypothetical protein
LPASVSDLDAELLLFPNLASLESPDFATLAVATGGGLVASFWQGDSEIVPTARRILRYGKIPTDAQPEQVLARISIAHAKVEHY